MNRKLSEDAFAYYTGLGAARSYQAVAGHFQVSKRTVVRTAEREQWNTRLEAIEKRAREATDQSLAGELQEMQLRHRKMLRAMASRAAKAISDFPLTTGMEGIKAAELVIKMERLLAGEPTERGAIDIEQIIKREYQELLSVDDGEPRGEEGGVSNG